MQLRKKKGKTKTDPEEVINKARPQETGREAAGKRTEGRKCSGEEKGSWFSETGGERALELPQGGPGARGEAAAGVGCRGPHSEEPRGLTVGGRACRLRFPYCLFDYKNFRKNMRRKIKITCHPTGLTLDRVTVIPVTSPPVLKAHFYLGSVRITEIEKGVTDVIAGTSDPQW